MQYAYTRQYIVGVLSGVVVSVWSNDGIKDPQNSLIGQCVFGLIRGLDFDAVLPLDQFDPAAGDRLKLGYEGSTSSITTDIILRIETVSSASVAPSTFTEPPPRVSIRPREPKMTPAPVTNPEPASLRSQTLKHALHRKP